MNPGQPYRESRCCNSDHAPQHIHWAHVDGDPRTVVRELTNAVKNNFPSTQHVDVIGEIRALFELVETCTAVDPKNVKNLDSDRDLWELRVEVRSFDLHIRVYETELGELPREIVALRTHQKVIKDTDQETKELQNAEIAIASRRWAEGRHSLWGLR